MSLIIITQKPGLSLENLKKAVKKSLGKNRGPEGVTASVIRGMRDLHQEYKLNPKIRDINEGDILWANESVSALQFAIRLKKKVKNLKLVAGPNLVVIPNENNGIIFDPSIDIILQPSEWTRGFYITHKPESASRIAIWPAGVEDTYRQGQLPEKEKYLILYQKNAPEDIFKTIAKKLDYENIDYRLVRYGCFDQKTYFPLLEKASGMIYLSTSESQGLALQEAWIRDVPTIVWDRGFWEKKGVKFEHNHISCPYLTDESGMTFRNEIDFPEKMDKFLAHLHNFKARNYSLQNLSDKVTTQKFLDIIRHT